MGDSINHFFESQMQWSYDNGVVYINGRDVVVFIAGFFTCILVVLAYYSLKEYFDKRNRS